MNNARISATPAMKVDTKKEKLIPSSIACIPIWAFIWPIISAVGWLVNLLIAFVIKSSAVEAARLDMTVTSNAVTDRTGNLVQCVIHGCTVRVHAGWQRVQTICHDRHHGH